MLPPERESINKVIPRKYVYFFNSSSYSKCIQIYCDSLYLQNYCTALATRETSTQYCFYPLSLCVTKNHQTYYLVKHSFLYLRSLQEFHKELMLLFVEWKHETELTASQD